MIHSLKVTRKGQGAAWILMALALALVATGGAKAALTAPALTAPVNGATVTLPVILQWSAVSGASFYGIQVAPVSNFAQLLVTITSVNAQVQIDELPASSTLYWRVRAVGSGNQHGPWSATGNFITAPAVLDAPTLVAPADGSRASGLPVSFSWLPVAGATGYILQIAANPAFPAPMVTHVDAGTTAQISSLPSGATLYWRVIGHADNTAGTWSATFSFVTPQLTVLPAPTLLAPADASTVSFPVTFSWSPVTGATAYALIIATDPAFQQLIVGRIVTGPNTTLITLPFSKKLHWRVYALAPGQIGKPSTAFSFTTPAKVTLVAPTLTAPANGSTGVLNPVTLTWDPVTNATQYEVEISSNLTFTNLLFKGDTADTTLTAPGLPDGQLVFWRVQALAPGQTGPWSAPWHFMLSSEQ
jgi:hypothetical protein